MDDVAKRIKHLRGSRTQRDFARMLNCNEATLRSYERGLSNPNFEFMHALCLALNVSTDWLVFGRGPVYGPVERAHVYAQPEAEKNSGLREEPGTYTHGCSQCALYEEELVREQEESRRAMVTAQFLLAENARLSAENGRLRTEKLHLQHALDTAAHLE